MNNSKPHSSIFQQAAFILNPRAGKMGDKRGVIVTIERVWGSTTCKYTLSVTRKQGEGMQLAREAVEAGCDLVVAVGGDGTLNEVVRGVLGSDIRVGLIPSGSGNGFARHWKVSFDPEISCRGLLSPQIVAGDVGKANDHIFLVTFGCGLDAVLSDRYARSRVRGMPSYFYHGIRSFFSYRSEETSVTIDGQEIYHGKPLLLTVANTTGYGGGTVIAPSAKADDGYLDLCVIDPLTFKATILNLRNIFNGKIEKVPGYQHTSIHEAVIKRERGGPIHADGDPFYAGEEIQISILPGAVNFALPVQS